MLRKRQPDLPTVTISMATRVAIEQAGDILCIYSIKKLVSSAGFGGTGIDTILVSFGNYCDTIVDIVHEV